MVYSIIIGTKVDGTKVAVSDPLPLREAKPKFFSMASEDLVMVELFDLRQHSKRRKLNRKVAADAGTNVPSFEQIVDQLIEQLAGGAAVLAEGDFTAKGLPKVGAVNKAFGVKLDSKAVAEIWDKVQEINDLQNARFTVVGIEDLSAELNIPIEELAEVQQLDGFPQPEGTDEETGDPIFDVEKVREFFNTKTKE